MTAPRAREQHRPPSPPDLLPSRRGGHPSPSTASASAADRPAGRARLPLARRELVGSARALAAAALFALCGALALPAQAQTVTTLVSNTGQSAFLSTNSIGAQPFTTGSAAGLDSVDVHLGSNAGLGVDDIRVRILQDDSGSPGTALVTLLNPTAKIDNAVNTFTAPPDTNLAADTTYWVEVSKDGEFGVEYQRTRSHLEDGGGATGWEIGNTRYFKNTAALTLWSTSTTSIMMIAIKGTAVEGGTPKPRLSVGDAEGDEGGGVTFTVTLSEAATDAVTATWTASFGGSGDTAVAADLGSTTGPVSIAANATTGTFTVPTAQDTTDEHDETFTVTLSAPSSSALLSMDPTATGTITDDDPPPALSVADASAPEARGSVTFRVTLSPASGKTVTVGFATSTESGDTATSPADFTANSVTLTFPPRVTRNTVTIQTVDDSIFAADETFTATLSSATNAVISDATAKGTIINDDAAPIVGTPSGDALVSNLGNSPAIRELDSEFSQRFTTGSNENGYTLTGVDIVSATNTPFTVKLCAIDTSGEPVSPCTSLVDPAEFVDGTNSFTAPAATLLVKDTTYSLYGGSPGNHDYGTTPEYGEDAAAGWSIENAVDIYGSSFSWSPQEDSHVLRIAIRGYEGYEGAATGPTLSVGDAKGDEGAGVTFTVTLSEAAAAEVTATWTASVSGSEDSAAAEDFESTTGPVSIAIGATTGTFTVPTAQDETDEVDETFTVTLRGVSANAHLAPDPTAKGTIIDADPPPTLSVADSSALEERGIVVFTVTLSGLTSLPVDVDYTASTESGDTATSPADFTAETRRLHVPANDDSVAIGIMTVNDSIDESDETFTVTLSNAGNATISDATAKGTIINDDGARPTVTIAADHTSFTAVLDQVTFTLTRTEDPAEALDVSVVLTQDKDLIGSEHLAQTVTFRAGEATATLNIHAHFFAGSTVTGETTLTATVQDGSDYVPGSSNTASTRIRVADPAVTASFEQAAYTFDEAAGDATVAVILRTATGVPIPHADIFFYINYELITGGASDTGDFEFSADAIKFVPSDFTADGTNFIARKEVTLAIVDDEVNEPDEALTLTLEPLASTPAVVALRRPDGTACPTDIRCDATVTITDNDESAVATLSALAVSGGGAELLTFSSDTTTYTAMVANDVETLTFTATKSDTGASVAYLDSDGNTLDDADTTEDGFQVVLAVGANAITVRVTAGTTIQDYTVTVTRAEALPTVMVAAAAGGETVPEGTDAAFTLSRTGATTAALTVVVAVSETGSVLKDASAVPSSVTFAAGAATATLALATNDDDTDDDNGTVTVTLGADTGYTVGEPGAATVAVSDNDVPVDFVLAVPATVAEDAGTATVTVTATTAENAPPATALAVQLARVGGTATGGTDYDAVSVTARFQVSDFAAATVDGQPRYRAVWTHDVTIHDDEEVEDDETVVLEMSPTSAFVLIHTLHGRPRCGAGDADDRGQRPAGGDDREGQEPHHRGGRCRWLHAEPDRVDGGGADGDGGGDAGGGPRPLAGRGGGGAHGDVRGGQRDGDAERDAGERRSQRGSRRSHRGGAGGLGLHGGRTSFGHGDGVRYG